MKKAFVFIFLFTSVETFSAEVPKSAITYISPWETHVDVEMATTPIDPENCGSAIRYRIDLINDPAAQAKLSVILSAFMAGKEVGLHISGCVADSPKIGAVRLYQ